MRKARVKSMVKFHRIEIHSAGWEGEDPDICVSKTTKRMQELSILRISVWYIIVQLAKIRYMKTMGENVAVDPVAQPFL